MRSSKSRSRSKSNRPRPLGNIINRVFDSSGPDGKVRGTPQQIIDKYLVLARDAQLSNDRVGAENFLQHAEHYTRLLAEAQREMTRDAENRRDVPDAQPRIQDGQGRGQEMAPQGRQQGSGRDDTRDEGAEEGRRHDERKAPMQPHTGPRHQPDPQPRVQPDQGDAGQIRTRGGRGQGRPATADAAQVIDFDSGADAGSGLVETPEASDARAARTAQENDSAAEEGAPQRTRRRAAPKVADVPADTAGDAASGDPAPSEAEAAKPAPRPRAPRKPRSTANADSGSPEGTKNTATK